MVGLCALVALPRPAHRHGCCRRRSKAGSRIRPRSKPTRSSRRHLGAKPIARAAAEDAAHSRSAQGPAAGLPDELDPQVDVGDPAGLDGARQGRRFPKVESQFHEAVFTHASTSPNQQLIAGLDVARRQMELEGYGLVMNAISIALKHPDGGQEPSVDLEVLPRPRRRRADPGGVPAVGLQGLSGARHELGRRREVDATRTSSISIRRA